MKQLVLILSRLFALSFCLSLAHAQEYAITEAWTFKNEAGNPTEDIITDVAVDSEGNVYVTGYFSGTVNVDPEESEVGRLSAKGKTDVFVAKYSADGKLWNTISLDYQGNSNQALSIALHGESVYVAGWGYAQPDDTDANATVFLLNKNLDSLRLLESSGISNEYAKAIAVHSNGNVYITGDFEGSIILDGFNKSVSGTGFFVAVYDQHVDTYLGGKASDGASDVEMFDIALDHLGNAYPTGEFQGDFHISPEVEMLNNKGERDIFFVKYNFTANLLEAPRAVSSTLQDRVRGIATGNEAIYITGNFQGATDFDPSPSEEEIRVAIIGNSGVEFDIFVAKYSLDGDFQKVYTVGGTSHEEGRDVKVQDEKVYLTGRIYSMEKVIGDTRFFNSIDSSQPEADAFLAIFDTALNEPEFVQRFGKDQADHANALAVASDGSVYIGGATDVETRPNCSGPGCDIKETQNTYLVKFQMKPPEITSIDPNMIVVADTITVKGKNFGNDPKVTIGGQDAEIESVNAEGTEISVIVPPLVAGEHPLVVFIGQMSDTATLTVIKESATVDQIFPEEGYWGTVVTMEGQHLHGAVLIIKGDTIEILENNGSQISFKIPKGIPEGTHTIEIRINGQPLEKKFTVITEDTPPILRDISQLTTLQGDTAVTFSAGASDLQSGVDPASVTLHYTGIRSNLFKTKSFGPDGENIYKVDLTASELAAVGIFQDSFEELGLQYYFTAEDKIGNADSTEKQYVYRAFGNEDFNLSEVAKPIKDPKKPSAKDYKMIAFSFQSQSIGSLLEELGAYGSKHNWRLFTYEPAIQDYKEYIQGEYSEPGKGYMLAYRNNTEDIEIGGEVVHARTDSLFSIRLHPGFNLIGNPFLFDIDWNDVLLFNKDTVGIEEIDKTLTKLQNAEPNDNILYRFEGAFVVNRGQQSAEVKIPIALASNADARLQKRDNTYKNLFTGIQDWFVPIHVENAGLKNDAGGFGMHAEADSTADAFDKFTMPRFMDYLEINFYHPEFFLSKFSKDIVPVQEAYEWEFEVASNYEEVVTLSWKNQFFNKRGYGIVLLDQHTFQLIDMLQVSQHTFPLKGGKRNFKIFYGDESALWQMVRLHQIAVGEAFPNPSDERISIPVIVPEQYARANCTVHIFNATGGVVRALHQVMAPGYQILQWDGSDQTGKRVNSGLYFYKVTIQHTDKVFMGKVLITR